MYLHIISLLQQVPSPEPSLLQYGVLGTFVFILSGVVYKLFNIILKDRDRITVQRDELITTYFTKVVPSIEKTTTILAARQELDKDILAAVRELTSVVEANKQTLIEVRTILTLGRAGNANTGGT